MRVAALEDNVAFLERWCEEQQDTLDRAFGSVVYDYEADTAPARPTLLRVVDLREAEDGGDGTIVAVVETDHDRTLQLVRTQLNRLRTRLAASLAPADGAEGNAGAQNLSERPAGRTAP
jgi:hypothetical protein